MLQPPAHAPNRARTVAQDVGGLAPCELPINSPENHFLHLHGSLHRRARVGHALLPGGHSCHAAPLERPSHVSRRGGQLTYLQHPGYKRLTPGATGSKFPSCAGRWLASLSAYFAGWRSSFRRAAPICSRVDMRSPDLSRLKTTRRSPHDPINLGPTLPGTHPYRRVCKSCSRNCYGRHRWSPPTPRRRLRARTSPTLGPSSTG